MRATQRILLKNGCHLDPHEVYSRWKMYHQQIISTLSAFTSEEAIFVAGLSRIYQHYGIAGNPREDVHIMLATLGIRRMFSDALPCLNRLRRRFDLVIASNTDSLPFLTDLRNNKLVVDKWFTSESLHAYKPHRTFYERMLEALGRAPQEVVFVGDSLEADVLGTITCGMHAIWLNRKRTSKPGVYGVHEISTLADLDKVITTVQTTAEAGIGALAGEAVAIEDSSRGLRSAMAAGIDCVVVRNEFTSSQDFSGAWRMLHSIRELPAALAAWSGA